MKSSEFSFSRRKFIKNASLAAAGLYVAPEIPILNIVNAPLTEVTRYGCLFQGLTPQQSIEKIQAADFNLIRFTLFLSQNNTLRVLDQYLSAGFFIQLNTGWMPTTHPTPFPTEIDFAVIKQKVIALFEKYKNSPYKDRILFLVIGNEWDNLNYHNNSIDYYLAELKFLTTIAHQYNYKVADAGITSTALQRWMYSQLTGQDAIQWKRDYFVGEKLPNYLPLLKQVEYYISKIKEIPIDYLNVHWYNAVKCSNGYPGAAGTYLERCGKTEVITNEFGQKIPSLPVWKQTVKEVSTFNTLAGPKTTKYALAYSGVGDAGKAIELTDEMLKELAN